MRASEMYANYSYSRWIQHIKYSTVCQTLKAPNKFAADDIIFFFTMNRKTSCNKKKKGKKKRIVYALVVIDALRVIHMFCVTLFVHSVSCRKGLLEPFYSVHFEIEHFAPVQTTSLSYQLAFILGLRKWREPVQNWQNYFYLRLSLRCV